MHKPVSWIFKTKYAFFVLLYSVLFQNIFPFRTLTVNHILYFSPTFLVPRTAPRVRWTSRSRNTLKVSWDSLRGQLTTGKLTGYRVCYFSKEKGEDEKCNKTEASATSYTIKKLYPSTKYFVTVAARTSAGPGERSQKISVITNGGKLIVHCNLFYVKLMSRYTIVLYRVRMMAMKYFQAAVIW